MTNKEYLELINFYEKKLQDIAYWIGRFEYNESISKDDALEKIFEIVKEKYGEIDD